MWDISPEVEFVFFFNLHLIGDKCNPLNWNINSMKNNKYEKISIFEVLHVMTDSYAELNQIYYEQAHKWYPPKGSIISEVFLYWKIMNALFFLLWYWTCKNDQSWRSVHITRSQAIFLSNISFKQFPLHNMTYTWIMQF